MLYLDNAATGPVLPEVLEAMTPFLAGGDRGLFGNPSSHHTFGEAAASALADARTRVARVLGMRAGDIVFTSGGTEANNLAVKGIVLAALAHGKRHLVTTPIEHESLLESAHYLRRFHGVEVTYLPVDQHGRVSPDDLATALRDDTALVSLGHANNEIGTVQDAPELVAVAREAGVPVHFDAVQSAGWLDLRDLGADAVSIAGHKLGAPKGIGVLAVRGRIPVEPLFHGGGQERGRRSGTENVAAAVGLAVALEQADVRRTETAPRVGALTARFARAVLGLVPSASLTGDSALDDPARRLPGTASFTLAGVSGESVLLELERRGVVSSSGSACAAGSDEASHVLVACGVPHAVAQTSIRFTFSRTPLPDNAPEALAHLVAEAVQAVA